jgi:glycosyltransferase involved in cell wall biosynthesis
MRIAYLGQMADVATENGVAKKIRSQAQAWQLLGHEVRYFSLTPTTAVWPGFRELPMELVSRGRFGQRPFRSLQLTERIRAWKPDAIYFRYAYHSLGFPRLFREIPTVAEINSDDRTEYPLVLSRAKVVYHRLTRSRVLTAVGGFVAVTHELGKRFESFGQPIEVIANGITLGDFQISPPATEGAARLVFVGTAGTPWHGLERVTELAELFPEIVIDVIGGTEADWRRITASSQIPPANLHFHGALPRERYEPLLRQATAAIGSLALFKNDMEEACPLKVREYLACGLPVIAAYRDTDIAPDADYFLRLPNDRTPLAKHRDPIASWLEKWRGRRVARETVAHLDTAVKEQRRLAFLSSIAPRRAS